MKYLKTIFESDSEKFRTPDFIQLNENDLEEVKNIFDWFIERDLCMVAFSHAQRNLFHGIRLYEGHIMVSLNLNQDLSMNPFINLEQLNQGVEQLNEIVKKVSMMKNYLDKLERKGYSWQLGFGDGANLLKGEFFILVSKIKK